MRSKGVLEKVAPRCAESISNPCVGRVRRRVTINIDSANLEYFKSEAARTGAPYQTIINLYLTKCREQGEHLAFA